MIRSSQTIPHGSAFGPEILKTLALRAYSETLQECVVLVLGEVVRFQWLKPLDNFTIFKTDFPCYGFVYDVGAAVYHQLEPTLAAP